jgi:hypothetical protein
VNARPAAKPSAVALQDGAPFRDQRVEPATTFPLGKSACGRRVESESPRRVHRVGYEWAFLAKRAGRKESGADSFPRRLVARRCPDARSWRKLMFYRGMTCEGDAAAGMI